MGLISAVNLFKYLEKKYQDSEPYPLTNKDIIEKAFLNGDISEEEWTDLLWWFSAECEL